MRRRTDPVPDAARDGSEKEPAALLAAISFGALLAAMLISLVIKLCAG